MKKVSEILNFFRLNNCEVHYYEASNTQIELFIICSNISKQCIFEGNEYQLIEFYKKVNNINN